VSDGEYGGRVGRVSGAGEFVGDGGYPIGAGTYVDAGGMYVLSEQGGRGGESDEHGPVDFGCERGGPQYARHSEPMTGQPYAG